MQTGPTTWQAVAQSTHRGRAAASIAALFHIGPGVAQSAARRDIDGGMESSRGKESRTMFTFGIITGWILAQLVLLAAGIPITWIDLVVLAILCCGAIAFDLVTEKR